MRHPRFARAGLPAAGLARGSEHEAEGEGGDGEGGDTDNAATPDAVEIEVGGGDEGGDAAAL